MGSKVPPCLNKIHNFGIYLKKGKRSILQLDFPSQQILVIRKGHVKRSFTFPSMTFFDSEDDLHIAVRFMDAVMDFDADTMEEKYTICRLLDLILENENSEDENTPGKMVTLLDTPVIPQMVIKDGVLEKKGNTTITTWNRRRVKICIGEFSYYKPGEELALNVVQLWNDRCRILKMGNNGFSISFSHRDYCFRIPNDNKNKGTVEAVREEWIKAFEKAMASKRHTIRLISPNIGGPGSLSGIGFMSDASSIDSQPGLRPSDLRQEQEQNRKDTSIPTNGIISANEKMPPQPPGMGSLEVGKPENRSMNVKEASNTGMESPEVGKPENRSMNVKEASNTDMESSEVGKPENRSMKDKEESNSIPLDMAGSAKLQKTLSPKELQVQEWVYQNNDILANSSNRPAGYEPIARDIWIPTTPPATSSDINSNSMKASAGGTAPPPPTAAPIPPPLLLPKGQEQSQRSKGWLKLKQVYWTPVERNQISVSLWSEIKTQLPALDLRLLEDMFSVSEKDATLSPRSKQAAKQTLLDPKRAQNLEILFSGFKSGSVNQFLEAINSVGEVESFGLQKLATLKKLQPTEEDVEMFRMYAMSRDALEPVDRFMFDLCEVPNLGMRIDLALSLWDFPNRYQLFLEEAELLSGACDALLESSALPTILRLLLMIGNHLNAGRMPKDGVAGFQLCSSVDKLVDMKGQNPQYTLMTYLVEQVRDRADLLDWPASLAGVPKVTGFSIRAVGAEVDGMYKQLAENKKSIYPSVHASVSRSADYFLSAGLPESFWFPVFLSAYLSAYLNIFLSSCLSSSPFCLLICFIYLPAAWLPVPVYSPCSCLSSHLPTSLRLLIFPSARLSSCLPVCLPPSYLPIFLSAFLFPRLSAFVYPSPCISSSLPASACLIAYLSTCLSVFFPTPLPNTC